MVKEKVHFEMIGRLPAYCMVGNAFSTLVVDDTEILSLLQANTPSSRPGIVPRLVLSVFTVPGVA